MDIERSRNGFYTLTFYNKHNLTEGEVSEEFNKAGKVCKVIQSFQRVFIRYKEKEEAEKAMQMFGEKYEVEMAKNRYSDTCSTRTNGNAKGNNSNYNASPPSPSVVSETSTLNEQNGPRDNVFHLILGNLPPNYTIRDVHDLVEEVNPLYISPLEETRVFNVRYCHVVMETREELHYLIDKLNGFTICGEKLIAAEASELTEMGRSIL